MLPDISVSGDTSAIAISWTSQYSGLKSISILRSVDDVNYATIDKIKNPAKGPQTYTDHHPAAGKNYYKLLIAFSSGLNWKSNPGSINTGKSSAADTAKKRPGAAAQKLAADTLKPADPVLKGFVLHNDTGFTYYTHTAIPVPVRKTDTTAPRVNTVTANTVAATNTVTAAPVKKIVWSAYAAGELAAPLSIKSTHVFIDTETGYIAVNLPEDLEKHHYSLKFFGEDNHLATEIPKLPAPKLLIDKRNFQRSGIYHFVLRRDGLEVEDGYISLVPNP